MGSAGACGSLSEDDPCPECSRQDLPRVISGEYKLRAKSASPFNLYANCGQMFPRTHPHRKVYGPFPRALAAHPWLCPINQPAHQAQRTALASESARHICFETNHEVCVNEAQGVVAAGVAAGLPSGAAIGAGVGAVAVIAGLYARNCGASIVPPSFTACSINLPHC